MLLAVLEMMPLTQYSDTSEQRTLWDQYKFKWTFPCIEVVIFKRTQSHYIDRGIKFGDLVLFIVERYIIHCPFIGGSYLRGSTVPQIYIDNTHNFLHHSLHHVFYASIACNSIIVY